MHLVVLAFIRVRSYKHTIYCVTKLVLPYIFSLVFRIAQSELGIVSNRDFLSAVSTAPRFLSKSSFFRFVGDQTQTSARPVFAGTLNHEHCNVYSPKAFEALIQENVTYIVFFVVCKIYFLLVLSKRWI